MLVRIHYFRVKKISIYFVLLTIGLLILSGRPKFIFQSHLHIPWLTDVQLVEPLTCVSVSHQYDWPSALQVNANDNVLTIVIVTAQAEFKRLPLTLAALACHLDSKRIFQVVFLVPERDVHILEPFLSDQKAQYWPWPLSIMADNRLLQHIHTDSYRLQMMFKLVVAQIIHTEYYMILDSDCIAIWPIHVEQLLWQSNRIKTTNHSLPLFKALYQIEDRSDRDQWWPESEQVLQIEPNTCVSTDPKSSTIGVTPVILSKTISLRTLCRLKYLYGDKNFLNKLANWALWRIIFDRMWTEYTLYYLTAQCTKTFDKFHFHRTKLPSRDSWTSLNFYGLSVWWYTDWTSFTRYRLVELVRIGLAWRQKEITQKHGQAMLDESMNTHDLFTVLQGRQYVNPNLYHELFYPLYIEHLKRLDNSKDLVALLGNMSRTLIKI